MKGPPYLLLPLQEEVIDESQIPSIRHALVFLCWNEGILLVCNKKTEMITGIGGRLDPGETPYDAAVRYLYDYGMRCRKLKLLGLIELDINNGQKKNHVHILSSNVFYGRLRQTEDHIPIWVRYIDIPYSEMPEDYSIWLPFLLQGVTFKGAFRTRNKRLIEQYKINVVYRGVQRYRHKKFGRPPCYRWQNLDIDDSLEVSDACYRGNPYDFNIMDQLSSDDKLFAFEDTDIYSEVERVLDEKLEDDYLEISE